MRAAIAEGHGLEMGTEGDSFFVVFASAADAVGCCVAAQRALAGHDWPGGMAVRVRMGLHSGEPTRYEDGYIGMDVHRAARIAATAHGGQVVMSEATWLLAASRLPAGVSVRDLGFHRLKDIDAPERIFQLTGPGLRERVPAAEEPGHADEPAGAGDAAGRPGRGTGAAAGGPRPAGGAAGDAHRHRRGRQDPAVPGGRRGARGGLPERGVLRRAGGRPRRRGDVEDAGRKPGRERGGIGSGSRMR